MVAILGIVSAAVAVSVALGVVSIGASVGMYAHSRSKAKEAEDRNEARMLQQERKAKVMHLKQFNQALAAYNTGALLAKKELVEAKRERANEIKYGSPERAS